MANLCRSGVALVALVLSATSPASAAPSSLAIGAELWQGSAAPGAPAAQPGCAPAIQRSIGAGLAAGYRNSISISKSERVPPGKILNGCIGKLVQMLDSLDVFSKTGPFIVNTIVDAVIQYGEKAICDVVQKEFQKITSMAFNSMAFLGDIVPCGVGISLPAYAGGSGGADICSAIGGPLVTVGAKDGQLYHLGGSAVPAIANPYLNTLKTGGGNVLGPLLGR